MEFILERKMPKLIDHAVKIVHSDFDRYATSDDTFNAYSPTYVFTTENLNGYYDHLDFHDKSVLTVVGSGDHIFEAILRGAKKIDAFDISGFAILFYYLKKAAIETLEYEEFVYFFLGQNLSFKRKSYDKIRTHLEPNASKFWDAIYDNCRADVIIESGIFREIEPIFIKNPLDKARILSGMSSYLNENNYNKLRSLISDCEVNCYIRDFYNLEEIMQNYDYMFFSNIIQFSETLAKFEKKVEQYINNLNIGGEIKIGYIYNYCLRDYVVDYKDPEVELENVPSAYETLMTPNCITKSDYILTYKKPGIH